MKIEYSKFIIKLLLLTISIFLIAFFIFKFFLCMYYLNIFPYLLMFFAIITALFHYFLIKSSQHEIKKFINTFMIFTGIKLMLYILFILIFILLNKSSAVVFVMGFIILYVIYSIFEIISIVKYLKKI